MSESSLRIWRSDTSMVAERWKRSYYVRGEWANTRRGSSEHIYNRLIALGPDAKPNDTDAVIGNNSWTHARCGGCDKDVKLAIAFTGSEGYNEYLCADCVATAHQLMADNTPA